MTQRRQNLAMRHIIDTAATEPTPERAAQIMLEHGVPGPVVARVIGQTHAAEGGHHARNRTDGLDRRRGSRRPVHQPQPPAGSMMPDAERTRARLLVARLYDTGPDAPAELHELLQDAAEIIDSYQAGLNVVTPHPLTGYALVKAASPLQQIPATEFEVTA